MWHITSTFALVQWFVTSCPCSTPLIVLLRPVNNNQRFGFFGGILMFPSPFQTAYLKACFNGRMQISWDSSSVGVVNDSLVSLRTSLNSGQKTHNTIFTAPLHPRPSTLSGAHADTRQSINLTLASKLTRNRRRAQIADFKGGAPRRPRTRTKARRSRG